MQIQDWLTVLVGSAAGIAALVSLIMAVVKTTLPHLKERYYPITVVTIGIAISWAVQYAMAPAPYSRPDTWFVGLLAGGIASGLFVYGKSKEMP